MDNQYYLNKIKNIFEEALSQNEKFALRDFVIFNRDIILQVINVGALSEAIELISAFIFKLPANCKLQQDLIKIVHEFLNENQVN